jgi:DNA-binding MurR/RpiR family transcriptional regulator
MFFSDDAMAPQMTKGPEEAKTLSGMRSRIVKHYSALSPQLQNIAQFALSNPDAMAVQTAQQLAKQLSVQPSSIVRFAQALGYSGFNEMKQGFRANLIYRMGEASEQEQIRKQPATGTVAVLDALLNEGRRDLDRIGKDIDRKAFDRAVAELVKADQIYVVGQQLAFPLASLFCWTLLRFDRQCHLLDNVGGFSLRMTELAAKDDVLLAISFPPYQSSVIQSAKQHFDRGGKVVALTDTPLSPLAPSAALLIEVPQRTPTTSHSLVAATCVVQALAIAIGETGRKAEP